MVVKRPALRWHGGKFLLAPWIISHFCPHRVYVEPYAGAGSVLMRKPRAYAEVYNDLDDDVINFFQVLRDTPEELIRLLTLTPFARTEFKGAYEHSDNPVEEARRLVIRSLMGFGSDGFNRDVLTGFRANSNRSGTTPAHDWKNYPDGLATVIERLRGVTIENRPAIQVMQSHDCDEALHYVDPPYLPSTRSGKSRRGKLKYHAYRHEMVDQDHHDMAAALHGLKGMVVLSGYHSELYDDLFKDWHHVEKATFADGARKRTEVLWFNPLAWARQPQASIFAEKRA